MAHFLLLIPMALLTLTQLVAVMGMPGEAHELDLAFGTYAFSWVVYAIGFLGAGASIVLALLAWREGSSPSSTTLIAVSIVTAVAVVTGPLLWGVAIGQFTPLHHLVRAALVIVVLVFYYWYVALHR